MSTRYPSGFCITDLLAVIAISAVAGMLLLVACDSGGSTGGNAQGGASTNQATQADADATATGTNPMDYLGELGKARRRGNEMQAMTQLRQVAQGLQMYQFSHGRMPRADKPSAMLEPILSAGNLTPESLVVAGDEGISAHRSGTLGPQHMSFAFLSPVSPGWGGSGQPRTPWAADRLIGTGSLWADPWQGHVAWADGSVTRHNTREVATQIGPHRHEADDLFTGDPTREAVLLHE